VRTKVATAIAAGLLLATSGAALHAGTPPHDAFGVGVLRRDGIIVPFAAFDGKRWNDNWPLPDAELDVPVSVRDVPPKWWGPTGPLEHWHAWVAGEPKSVRVVQPDWVDAHCVRQVGLRTDYRSARPAPPLTEQPFPKDGIAVSPPQPMESIVTIPAQSEETRALIPVVHEAFNTAEREVEKRFGHPLTRREREGRVPDIEAIYAAGDRPRTYYVEALRRYRRLGQSADECTAVAFASGWFTRDGGAPRSLLTTVDLLRCDRRGASYMLPLAAMHLGGRLYWFAQFSGWDHERYAVIEVKRKTVEAVLNIWGGSC
jgi:hypothetical protein